MEIHSQTLFEEIASCWAFELTWSLMQVAMMLFFVTVFLLCSAFTRRGTEVGVVIVLSSCYLGINQLCWVGFLIISGWQGGELVFDFGLRPFIPAFSFYLGMVVLTTLLCTLNYILRRRKEYSLRQLASMLMACILLIVGVAISARTPVALQQWLDEIGPGVGERTEGWSQPPPVVIDPVKDDVN